MSRDPGDGEGQGDGKRRRTRRPRPSPSQLSPEEASDKAFAVGLRLLSHRERSRAELKIALRRKGYGADTIAGVLDRLEESGLQSDARFAEVFTQEAHRGRGLSTSAVQGELRRRGVEAGLAAEAARARAVAGRRATRLSGMPPDVRRRRLEGFLARRGYPGDLCRRIAAEVTAEDRIP